MHLLLIWFGFVNSGLCQQSHYILYYKEDEKNKMINQFTYLCFDA